MSGSIRVNAVHSILEGHVDEVKKMSVAFVEQVEAGEPGYLSYEWFLSDDETKLYIVGLLTDSAAVMHHLTSMGDMIGRFSEIAPTARIEIYGDVSDELREFVAPFGPEIAGHLNGFTR